MDKTTLLHDLATKMENTLKTLDNSLKGLRTGRASTSLLEPIHVEAYSNKTPLSQLATLSTPDSRTIHIQVWDKAMTKTIEKAIIESNLGLNPSSEGQVIRITIPPLSEERRKELVKLAHKYGEEAKVALRNIRRDGNDYLKKLEKDKLIAEDEHHNRSEEVQKLTNDFIHKVEIRIQQKEKEILTI